MKVKKRVSVPPNGTIAGSAKLTGSDWLQELKAGNTFTSSDTDRVVDPPMPVQVMLYVVARLGVTEADPEAPDGEKPAPLQDVALVDDQVSVDDPPRAT